MTRMGGSGDPEGPKDSLTVNDCRERKKVRTNTTLGILLRWEKTQTDAL